MVSLQVELDEKLADAVRRLAAALDRSESALVQDVLAVYVRERPRLPKGIGKYRSGCSDVSENARQILSDAVKEGKWP